MKRAYLKQVLKALEEGGSVQFVWITVDATLYVVSGETYRIDGRAYHAFIDFVKKNTYNFSRNETGSVDTKDLVIIWKKA